MPIDPLEISFEDIKKDLDPYNLFLESLKNHHTHRKYKNQLNEFLKLIPAKIYEDVLQKSPQNREPSTLAMYFVELAKKNPDVANRIVAQFIKKEIELVKQGQMSPNTLPNHIKPIKALLDSNGAAMHWKSLYRSYPRGKPAADDRAYTREELQKIADYCQGKK